MKQQGFVHNSNEAYHSGPGLGSTGIKDLLRSPAHFLAERKVTPALEFGAGFHLALEDWTRFEEQYILLPFNDLRTNKAKEFKAEIEADGKHIIKQEEYDDIKAMIEAIKQHPDIGPYLGGDIDVELSGYWYYPDHPDLLCKLRMDVIYKTEQIIFDFKSTTDAREEAFKRAAYNNGYHISGAWYSYGCTIITGIEHTDFRLVAVEKKKPHGINVFQLDPEILFEGQRACARGVGIYLDCLANDIWPNYASGLKSLGLPGWVQRQTQSVV